MSAVRFSDSVIYIFVSSGEHSGSDCVRIGKIATHIAHRYAWNCVENDFEWHGNKQLNCTSQLNEDTTERAKRRRCVKWFNLFSCEFFLASHLWLRMLYAARIWRSLCSSRRERERESCWQLALNQGMDEANEDSDDDGDDQKEMYAAQCTVYTLDWVPLHVENETRSMVGKRGTTNWNKSHWMSLQIELRFN